MQVFIVGTPLETAIALDKLRLNKQVIEARQILDALDGKSAWSNHPCTLQYRKHQEWLKEYRRCLVAYFKGDVTKAGRYSYNSSKIKPYWHTEEYLSQMKRRLYTKNNEHYKQWEHLGESQQNWYFESEWLASRLRAYTSHYIRNMKTEDLNWVLQQLTEAFAFQESDGIPCDCCGDCVTTYTLEL